MEGLYQIM